MNTHLTLYADRLWLSPYGFSSFVALKEKGLAFDLVELSLPDGEHLSNQYETDSITARIPSLVHDGFGVSESSAIAEYLEEAFPPTHHAALFPRDLRDRARARQLMAWLRSDLDALRQERMTITVFYRLRVPELSPRGVTAAAKLVRVAEQVIPKNGGPLFGSWSLVNSELSFMLHRLILNGHPVPQLVQAYADVHWKRASAQEFIGHKRPASVPENYWGYSDLPRMAPA